jgi:anti-anti-sigma regulatory factor
MGDDHTHQRAKRDRAAANAAVTFPHVDGRPDAAFGLDIGAAVSTTVLSVVGPIDREDAAILTSLGVMALGGAGVADLVVDLSEAFVLDLSPCLGCLLDLQDAAEDAAVSLHIAGASPEVACRLVAAGMSDLSTADMLAWRAAVPVDSRLPGSVLLDLRPTRVLARSIEQEEAAHRSPAQRDFETR